MQIGEITGTTVALAYVNNIASPKVVDEVRKQAEKDPDRCNFRKRLPGRIY